MAGLSCQSAQIIHKMNRFMAKKALTNQLLFFAMYAKLAMEGENPKFLFF